MSHYRIKSIDSTINTIDLRTALLGLSFEYISGALRLLLGEDYFIYEGNNHIVVQRADTNERLIVIERI